jgi:hypothetical protein
VYWWNVTVLLSDGWREHLEPVYAPNAVTAEALAAAQYPCRPGEALEVSRNYAELWENDDDEDY